MTGFSDKSLKTNTLCAVLPKRNDTATEAIFVYNQPLKFGKIKFFSDFHPFLWPKTVILKSIISFDFESKSWSKSCIFYLRAKLSSQRRRTCRIIFPTPRHFRFPSSLFVAPIWLLIWTGIFWKLLHIVIFLFRIWLRKIGSVCNVKEIFL